MGKFFLVQLVLLLHMGPGRAQYADLLGKPYRERLDAIHWLYWTVVENDMDTERLADTLSGMRWLARQAGDRELGLEADLLEAYHDHACVSGNIDKLLPLVTKGQREGAAHISFRAAFVIAGHHWTGMQYEQAFRWYATLDSMLRTVTVFEFPNKVRYLKEIGSAYYHFGDYERAIAHFKAATQTPLADFYEYDWKHSLNNMGLAYQHLDSLGKSDSCFRLLRVCGTKDVERWVGIASGNLGYNHYLRGNDDEAMPLLEHDIALATKYGDFGLASGSAIPAADILIRKGQTEKAKAYLDSAYAYIGRSGQTDRLRLFYPVMGRWYAVEGDGPGAVRSIDSMRSAEARYQQKFSAMRLLRAEQEEMAAQRVAALERLRADTQRQLNRRNMLLATLAIVAACAGFLAYRRHKAQQRRLEDRDLQLSAADRELQEARAQLDQFVRRSVERERTVENRELIEQLNRQVVLTDDDWQRFSALFGKVYPGFQHALKERFPVLTAAEIRCLAMEKLRLSTKEMAALQGISNNAVVVTKHRIRKKLGLEHRKDMLDFVQSVSSTQL